MKSNITEAALIKTAMSVSDSKRLECHVLSFEFDQYLLLIDGRAKILGMTLFIYMVCTSDMN